jgi:serine phosphatase RsbU (regulator of sigma subunit)
MICHNGKASALFLQPAVPLGVIPDQKYQTSQVPVSSGSSLIMYTDGLIEARKEDSDPFGEAGVIDAVTKSCEMTAHKMAQSIIKEALDYSNDSLRDDIALLILKINQLAPDANPIITGDAAG